MDNMTKANRASELLSDPVLKQALNQLTNEVVDALENSPYDGSLKAERYREKLNLHLSVTARFKGILSGYIATGKLESKKLERKSMSNPRGL